MKDITIKELELMIKMMKVYDEKNGVISYENVGLEEYEVYSKLLLKLIRELTKRISTT